MCHCHLPLEAFVVVFVLVEGPALSVVFSLVLKSRDSVVRISMVSKYVLLVTDEHIGKHKHNIYIK